MKNNILAVICNSIQFLIYFLIFIFLLLGCSESSTNPPSSQGKIIGTVKTTNGNLLHNVDVHLVYQLEDESSSLNKSNISPNDVIYGEMTATINLNLNVELWWETSSESNNKGFDIERKFYEGEFEKIGYVAGYGTTTELHTYSFVDSSITGGNYAYRFKHIAYDGTFGYSQVLEISTVFSADRDTLYQNFPNPFSSHTRLRYDLKQRSNCVLDIKKFSSNTSFVEILNNSREEGWNRFNFENTNVLSNNLYKIEFKAESDSSSYTHTIFALKNEKNTSNLVNTASFTKTINGKFEINIEDLPINKKVAITSGNYNVLKEQLISNTLKFVLHKTGFRILEYDYLIDLNGINELSFILEEE